MSNIQDKSEEINILLAETSAELNSDLAYMVQLLQKYNIHKSWYQLFINTHTKLVPILKKINEIRQLGEVNVFPPANDVFKVFTKDINDIKIILLGQDPYPKKGHAMGLAFSVNKDITMAMSVFNMFKELKMEYPERKYNFVNGDLTPWFDRGMFLLNSALTVIEGNPNSQQSMWTWFTDICIEYICAHILKSNANIVFLLFGANAISKSHIIRKILPQTLTKIVTCTHPSPMSAHNGFFGSNVFKKVDELLDEPFDWSN